MHRYEENTIIKRFPQDSLQYINWVSRNFDAYDVRVGVVRDFGNPYSFWTKISDKVGCCFFIKKDALTILLKFGSDILFTVKVVHIYHK